MKLPCSKSCVAEDEASNEITGSGDALIDDESTATEESTSDDLIEDEVAEVVSDDLVDEENAISVEETPPAPVIVTTPTNQSPSFLDGILPPAVGAMLVPILASVC